MPIRFCSLIARTAALSASRAIAALLALTIAPAILAPTVALAQGTLPTGNLVTNPSANNGISGWTNVQGQFSVRTSAPPTFVFWGGTAASSVGRQDIGVWSWAAQIDSGCVTASFEARLGGFEAQADNAYVVFEFLNASGAVITNSQLGPVTAAQRGNVTQLLQRSNSGVGLPPGTRTIRVGVYCQRSSGTNNDGYADDISVRLFEVPGCCTASAPVSISPSFPLQSTTLFASPGQFVRLIANIGSNSPSSYSRLRLLWNGTTLFDGAPVLLDTFPPTLAQHFQVSRATSCSLNSPWQPTVSISNVQPESAGIYTLEFTGRCGRVEQLSWTLYVGCEQPPSSSPGDSSITQALIFARDQNQSSISMHDDVAAVLAGTPNEIGRRIGILRKSASGWTLDSILNPPSGEFFPQPNYNRPVVFVTESVFGVLTAETPADPSNSWATSHFFNLHRMTNNGIEPVAYQRIFVSDALPLALEFDGVTLAVTTQNSIDNSHRFNVYSVDTQGMLSLTYDEPFGDTIPAHYSIERDRMVIVRYSFDPMNRQLQVRERQGTLWPVIATLEQPAEAESFSTSLRGNEIVTAGSDFLSVFHFRDSIWQRVQTIAKPFGVISTGTRLHFDGSVLITPLRMGQATTPSFSTGQSMSAYAMLDGTLVPLDGIDDPVSPSSGSSATLHLGSYLLPRTAELYDASGLFIGSSSRLISGKLRIPSSIDTGPIPMVPLSPSFTPGGTVTLTAMPGVCDPSFSFWRFRGIVIDRSGPLPAPYQNMVATVQTDINAQGVTTLDSVTITNLDPTATPDDFTYFRSIGCSVGIHYPQLSEGPDAANDTAPGPSIPLPGTFRSVVGTFSNLSPDHFRLVIPPHEGLKVHTIDFSEYFTASQPGAPAIRVELLGLSQANGVIDPNAPVAATTQIRTGITSALEDPTVFYTHGPTSPVFVDVRVTPVAPELDGAAYTLTVFSSASQDFSLPTPLRAGQVTISAQSPAPTQDVDMWLYDEQFNPVPFAGNDDVAVLDDRAEFSISLPRGTYHLAVARGDVINNQPAAPGDLQQFGPVFASPNLTAGSDHGSEAPTAQIALTFTTPDGNQTLDVQTSRYIAWVKVQVNPVPPCNPADIADTDAGPGSDGVIDNGDFTLFFVAFFSDSSSPLFSLADIANTDGVLPADGVVDNGDFTRFFVSFFEGCP